VRRERHTRREARERSAAPVVALVGYTNAGKSTLFNALTRGGAVVSDQLFMTLDPLVRRVRLGGGRDLLLVDTVGFIQKLPHQLVAAFRATLEEVVEADLLLHVVDASAEDVELRESAVETVLGDIGAGERPRILVLNKADGTPPARLSALAAAHPGAVAVSALTGDGLPGLLREVAGRLDLVLRSVRLRFAAGSERVIAGVYASGRVLSHEVVDDEVRIQAELPERVLERYREHIV
jgi:GTP-binding protein HflX